jgi:ABC-type oligopeptide transport system substrate-binding subunit
MTMKTIHIVLVTLACAATIPAFVACTTEETSVAGPVNQASSSGDSGTTTQTDGSTGPDGADPAACDNGVVFDNAGRVPGWPNVPQP